MALVNINLTDCDFTINEFLKALEYEIVYKNEREEFFSWIANNFDLNNLINISKFKENTTTTDQMKINLIVNMLSNLDNISIEDLEELVNK
ncbi:hypothetical protein ACT4R9_05465 [Ornithobacterium rhinotracheale]|uniref:hypothetical protein n=1 Tax=Ornithobacterium rhinotracheale TaxID=28251 RepID=UPI003FA45B83